MGVSAINECNLPGEVHPIKRNSPLTISHHAEEVGREVEFPRPAVRAALISAFCLLHRFVVVVILDRGAPNNLDGRTMSLERGWGLHSPRPIGSLPFVARSPLPAYSPRNNFRRHPPSPAPPPAPALHGIVRRQTILRDPLVRMLLPMSSFQQRSVGAGEATALAPVALRVRLLI